ncbi:MAG: TolC family protein [Acidobacteria bacterium]|nr:TolC family protein [Acidobacteriota bacterium]
MLRHTPCLLAAVLSGTSTAETGQPDGLSAEPGPAPADRVARGIADESLRVLVQEALARNPGLKAGFARARAAAQKAPQVASLPDPTAEATAFLLPPETRVGPQRLMLGFSQALPWLAKLDLKEAAALQEAVALEREVQADRLRLVTDVRRLYYELLFLDRSRATVRRLLDDLDQHEEVAQARYATGVGSTQAVLKLQAEMTQASQELLNLDSREAALRARLNGLRDRPAATPVTRGTLPEAIGEVDLKPERLLDQARSVRPELQAADARLARADLVERLARMARRPDFRVGVTYTLVTSRDDDAARLLAIQGDGNDVFGLRGGVTLPVRKRSRAAAIQEALDLRSHAVDEKRHAELSVETEVGDLTERLPLAWRRLRLLEDLLVVQADEALESAEAGYIAGALNSLDLVDAEEVLFEALTAVDKARVDYLIGLAELEGAVGRPLPAPASGGTEQ